VARAWRDTFHADVVVHLSGYRRNGHNEGDDASYTQPLEHAAIQTHPSISAVLAANGCDVDPTAPLAELDAALASVRARTPHTTIAPAALPVQHATPPAVTRIELDGVLAALEHAPDGFATHPKLARQLAARRTMWDAGACDWALAELLALGVTARSGRAVRLVGEDARRGTFAHRHAALVDVTTGERHVPLAALGEVSVFDSLLSEYAAMGFEYGYQLERPDALVAWEAQFGDFANVAQVVIDQYLAAGEDKWGVHNGLVLLLPHGFEGQGPEHSSARLERFLQLAANGTLRICQPSTAAQWFHLLVEHTHATPRRPLVVMAPKQPLRMAQTRSSVTELTDGAFSPVLADPARPADPTRVVLCSGKLAWDLLERRDRTGAPVEILRVEQLHPFPPNLAETLTEAFSGSSTEVVWAQDEPLNQGAWRYVQACLADAGVPVRGVGRAERGSPATGFKQISDAEAELVVTAAVGPAADL
jgi:2-oxoglutarate decarboxylase